MMDFFVREARAILSGPMAIIRLGTCGSLVDDDDVGQYVLSTSSCHVTRNVDVFTDTALGLGPTRTALSTGLDSYYHISKPCQPSTELTRLVQKELQETDLQFGMGANCSADSFYASQGRLEHCIRDANDGMLDLLRDDFGIRSLEMETFQLFHLAQCCTKDPHRRIHAASLMLVAASRPKNTFIALDDKKHQLEIQAGRLCLQALAKFPLTIIRPHPA